MAKIFAAYPYKPHIVSAAIRSLSERINQSDRHTVVTWETLETWGLPFIDPILSEISSSDVLIADISVLNFNVTFEVGFAIGSRRRALLIIHNGVDSDSRYLNKLGIYDTLTHRRYDNSDHLYALIDKELASTAINFKTHINRRQPLYLVEKPVQTDDINQLRSRIKKAHVGFRSFAPSEEPRMSGLQAIQQVSESTSVLVPLANVHEKDAAYHNARSAFVRKDN